MACENIFYDYLSCGITEDIEVIAGLIPATSYGIKIQTPNFGMHRLNVTTDASGNFTIPNATFLPGELNPYAGPFQIQLLSSSCFVEDQILFNDTAYCTPYKILEFIVIKTTGIEKTSIGCNC